MPAACSRCRASSVLISGRLLNSPSAAGSESDSLSDSLLDSLSDSLPTSGATAGGTRPAEMIGWLCRMQEGHGRPPGLAARHRTLIHRPLCLVATRLLSGGPTGSRTEFGTGRDGRDGGMSLCVNGTLDSGSGSGCGRASGGAGRGGGLAPAAQDNRVVTA